ncbi:hypothetical protein GF327_06455 [Candidatus Woesearchaeota archaeon]|nr:hypothetical protein [Candidatus Woesearchaeota archaeon]
MTKKKYRKKPYEGCIRYGKNKYGDGNFFDLSDEEDEIFHNIIQKVKEEKQNKTKQEIGEIYPKGKEHFIPGGWIDKEGNFHDHEEELLEGIVTSLEKATKEEKILKDWKEKMEGKNK